MEEETARFEVEQVISKPAMTVDGQWVEIRLPDPLWRVGWTNSPQMYEGTYLAEALGLSAYGRREKVVEEITAGVERLRALLAEAERALDFFIRHEPYPPK